MNLQPSEFIALIKAGNTEKELNKTESGYIDQVELAKLTSARYGHTIESATEHLLTDYSNGYTICKECGSFAHLGKGFTKHISQGCLHCEGQSKHRVYHVNASKPSEGGFPARYMSVMFDDGIHYTKDKLQVELYKAEFENQNKK
jgi:hypothetical protein